MRTRVKQESIVIRLEGSLESQSIRDQYEVDRAICELKAKGFSKIHPQTSKKNGYKVLTLTGVQSHLEE